MKAWSVRRDQQERINTQPAMSFYDFVVDAVAWEQEEEEATVMETKGYEPLHLKEETLAPSRLSATQIA